MERKYIYAIIGILLGMAGYTSAAEPTWREVAPMLIPRMEHCAVAVDGRIFVFGGQTVDGRVLVPLSSVEMYDPEKDRWHRRRELPFSLYQAGAAVLGDNILIFGGLTARGEMPSKSVLLYNIPLDTFLVIGSLPGPRYSMGVVQADSRILVIGGLGKICCDYLNDGLYYEDENFINAPFLPTPLAQFGIASRDSSVWVVGGLNRGPVPALIRLRGGVWNNLEPMRQPIAKLGSAFWGDTLVIAGGYGPASEDRTVQILATVKGYDVVLDKWLDLPDMLNKRCSFPLVEINHQLYAIGGLNAQRGWQAVVLGSVEALDRSNEAGTEPEPINQFEMVSVHPNPTNGPIIFTLPPRTVSVRLYTVAGSLIGEQLVMDGQSWSWDTSGKPAGLYIYEVSAPNGSERVMGKFVVVK